MLIRIPTTALELMENLFDALRNRSVFDEAFYTKENLKKITGAQELMIFRDGDKIEARTFGLWLAANSILDDTVGLSANLRLDTLSNGKKFVLIRGLVDIDEPLLYYLSIERLLDYAWQPCKPGLMDSSCFYETPTDPYGNRRMEYRHSDSDVEEEGFFMFEPTGFLSRFRLRQNQR